MRFLAFGPLLCISLGACALEVTRVSKDHVSVKYHRLTDYYEEIQAIANNECAVYGRRDVFKRRTPGSWHELMLGYAHFACVK